MTASEILDGISETLMQDERILSVPERELLTNLLQQAKACAGSRRELQHAVTETIARAIGETVAQRAFAVLGTHILNQMLVEIQEPASSGSALYETAKTGPRPPQPSPPSPSPGSALYETAKTGPRPPQPSPPSPSPGSALYETAKTGPRPPQPSPPSPSPGSALYETAKTGPRPPQPSPPSTPPGSALYETAKTGPRPPQPSPPSPSPASALYETAKTGPRPPQPSPPSPSPASAPRAVQVEPGSVAVLEMAPLLPAKYVVLDEFLAPEELDNLTRYTLQREADFQLSEVVSPGVSGGLVDFQHRRSRVLQDLGGHREVILNRIQTCMPRVLDKLGHEPFAVARVEAQITASADGDFFRWHCDNGLNEIATREITFVYFFHREPKAFHGGELRIYDSRWENDGYVPTERYHTIAPQQNQVVFFPSALAHEITPVECSSQAFADSRFTVNGWFHR